MALQGKMSGAQGVQLLQAFGIPAVVEGPGVLGGVPFQWRREPPQRPPRLVHALEALAHHQTCMHTQARAQIDPVKAAEPGQGLVVVECSQGAPSKVWFSQCSARAMAAPPACPDRRAEGPRGAAWASSSASDSAAIEPTWDRGNPAVL